jgi:hypothetical protein
MFLDTGTPERVVDYAIALIEALKVYARGPFKSPNDNSQGICWVDVASTCELVDSMLAQFGKVATERIKRRLTSRSRTRSIARHVVGMGHENYQGTDQYD